MYSDVVVMTSLVKSDHKAILISNGQTCNNIHKIKTRQQIKFRCSKPADNARYLHYIQNNFIFDISEQTLETTETQVLFDQLYEYLHFLLDQFFPLKTVTITSRDPPHVTPQLKHLLRQKNKLMKQGKIDSADAIAKKISDIIMKKNASVFSKANPISDTKGSLGQSAETDWQELLLSGPENQHHGRGIELALFQHIYGPCIYCTNSEDHGCSEKVMDKRRDGL